MHAVNSCPGETPILLSSTAAQHGELGYPGAELIGHL